MLKGGDLNATISQVKNGFIEPPLEQAFDYDLHIPDPYYSL